MFSFIVAFILIELFIVPFLILILWNMTLPELLSLKHINFWQAFRINLLCALLFGGAHLAAFNH